MCWLAVPDNHSGIMLITFNTVLHTIYSADNANIVNALFDTTFYVRLICVQGVKYRTHHIIPYHYEVMQWHLSLVIYQLLASILQTVSIQFSTIDTKLSIL